MPTPKEQSLAGKIAAHTRWSRVDDRSAATAPARRAFMERFEDQVDPQRILSPDERARRAESARQAYFAELALKSAQARRRRREAAA